ncbi:MAG: hypothetical protein WCJ84_02475 [Candidatus Peregrinibacteria bacterium]
MTFFIGMTEKTKNIVVKVVATISAVLIIGATILPTLLPMLLGGDQ